MLRRSRPSSPSVCSFLVHLSHPGCTPLPSVSGRIRSIIRGHYASIGRIDSIQEAIWGFAAEVHLPLRIEGENTCTRLRMALVILTWHGPDLVTAGRTKESSLLRLMALVQRPGPPLAMHAKRYPGFSGVFSCHSNALDRNSNIPSSHDGKHHRRISSPLILLYSSLERAKRLHTCGARDTRGANGIPLSGSEPV
jgi:hypothetical protein